jgi:hypothetical protein
VRSRIAMPSRTEWRDYLNARWLIALATTGFIWMTIYAYRDLIALDPYLNANGFRALIPSSWTVPAAIVTAMVPLIWIRRQMKQVSDFCVLFLYFFVFVPSCVMLPYTSYLSEGRQFSILLLLLIAFGAVEVRRFLPQLVVPKIETRFESSFRIIMVALVIFQSFVFLVLGSVSLQNIVFFEVYENRAAFFADTSATRVLVGYVSNWAAIGIAPVMLIYGLHNRRYLFAGIGLFAALLAFSATSFRSHLFVPILSIGLYYIFRATGARRAGLGVLLLALSVSVIPVIVDFMAQSQPAFTWMIQFRFVGNNGFLTSQYFNVFETLPKGYFADSIGRFFFEPSYNVPIAQVVGESFSTLRGNHANANLWADGYGNFGVFGVVFATVELVVFLWIVDSVTRGQSLYVTAPIMLSAAFALSNTSVHSMLTSNGGLLLLLLLAALPYASVITARQPSKLAFSRP